MENNTQITNKENFNSILPEKFIFICYASFEERSCSIPSIIESRRITKSIILKSAEVDNKHSADKIREKIDRAETHDLDLDNPVKIAETLTQIIEKLEKENSCNLVIDVTTFTHEILLMLIKLIHSNKHIFPKVYCLYNGADGYSVGDSTEHMWLSKGCREVRNIIGYPGVIRPDCKTRLILLTGFETERATRLIELLEPDMISLGKGVEPINDNHIVPMKYFIDKLNEWINNCKNNCETFDFSCKDVEQAITSIENVINKHKNENLIIIPLNTKLSTIATALIAIKNPNIQVCYSIPEMYNTQNYSTPGDGITVVHLHEMEIYK